MTKKQLSKLQEIYDKLDRLDKQRIDLAESIFEFGKQIDTLMSMIGLAIGKERDGKDNSEN